MRWVLAVCVLLFAGMGVSMAFGKNLVLFSEVNGQVLDGNGKAATGVLIRRTWRADGLNESGEDATTTDEGGRFAFPSVATSRFLSAFLPQTPTVLQEITAARPDGSTLVLYSNDKSNYDADGELVGSPYTGPGLNILCRIDEEAHFEGWFFGTCSPAK